MAEKLNVALEELEITYRELVEIANETLAPIFDPINQMVWELQSKINSLTIDQIRDYILKLQLKAFEISEIKEKSAMKAELSDGRLKEKYAIIFNSSDGAVAARDKLATVGTAEEVGSKALQNLMSNLLKTKLDQLHRLVDALKSILMSRMQELKFMNLGATDDPDQFKTINQIKVENSYQI